MPTTPITVQNGSFEQTNHGDGAYSSGIPGWTITDSGSGEAGDYDPRSSEIDTSTVDGENVAYLYSGSSGGSGVTISQTLAATYEAGNTYTLSVDIGDGSYGGSYDQPYTLNILAGTTVIGTISGTTGDIDGLQTVTLNSTVNDPSLNGQPLTIEISDPAGSGGGEFLVDNVQFFETVEPDGIVEGTAGADLIDETYVGDPHGDVVNDTISPLVGTGPNDDSVQAGGGNDTILTGAGDDTISGGSGADMINGGTGADSIDGGSGADTITLSEGDIGLGSDGNDLLIFEDLGEAGSANISVGGGGSGESPGVGDTLDLGGTFAPDRLTITGTFTNASGNESYNGTYVTADGSQLEFSDIENIICFTPGTRILTPSGPRAVETLAAGDPVLTRDNGIQRVQWIGTSTVTGRGQFAPVRIHEGFYTGQLDALLVSPQHRVLFTGFRAQLLLGESEVLVPAKYLVECGAAEVAPQDNVSYIHLLFDQHEIVFSNGMPTESFHPGEVGLAALPDPCREEIFALFPDLRSNAAGWGQAARRSVRPHEARALMAA